MTASDRADVTAIGGRTGRVLSADGALRLALSTNAPPGASRGTSPEQLLAAACAASFLDAIVEAARANHLTIAADSNVTASVARTADGAAPEVRLTIDLPRLPAPVAEMLVGAAEALCSFSAMLRNHVSVILSIN